MARHKRTGVAGILAALLVPTSLAGCVGCVGFDDGCAGYYGAYVVVHLTGTYDTRAIEEAFRGEANATFSDRAMLVADEWGAFVQIGHMDPNSGATHDDEGATLLAQIYDRDAERKVPQDAADARAQQRWPTMEPTYDRIMAKLAEAGLQIEPGTEPHVSCYCGDD